jgi:hypothetical protein
MLYVIEFMLPSARAWWSLSVISLLTPFNTTNGASVVFGKGGFYMAGIGISISHGTLWCAFIHETMRKRTCLQP